MTVKAVVAEVEGYKKRFTLVSSALGLSGLEMVELFAARFRQEDGFRDLKQRLGWEECRAWTKTPIERTTPGAVDHDEPAAAVAIPAGCGGDARIGGRPPPWNKKKDRPSVLDVERLLRRHRPEIQRLLSNWLGDEEKAA